MKYKPILNLLKKNQSVDKKLFERFFDEAYLTDDNIKSFNRMSFREVYPYPHLDDNKKGYIKYIIVGSERTGSSYLVELLKSHPAVISYSELFMPDGCLFNYLGYRFFSDKALLEFRDNHPVDFVKRMVFKPYKKEIDAVGFKLLYEHKYNNRIQAALNYLRSQRKIKIIHIQRDNLFQSLVSRKVALKEGPSKYPEWVSKEVSKLGMGMGDLTNPWLNNQVSIYIDNNESLEYFKKIENEKQYFAEYFKSHPHMDLYYEDMVSDMKKQSERIQSFLEIEYNDLKTYSQKQVQLPLHELISNYYELREKFAGTRWNRFFNE